MQKVRERSIFLCPIADDYAVGSFAGNLIYCNQTKINQINLLSVGDYIRQVKK